MLRSAVSKEELVRAKVLSEADLTQEERDLPEVLSAFMVLVSVLVPLGILALDKCKKPEAEPEAEDKHDNPILGKAKRAPTTRMSTLRPRGRAGAWHKRNLAWVGSSSNRGG